MEITSQRRRGEPRDQSFTVAGPHLWTTHLSIYMILKLLSWSSISCWRRPQHVATVAFRGCYKSAFTPHTHTHATPIHSFSNHQQQTSHVTSDRRQRQVKHTSQSLRRQTLKSDVSNWGPWRHWQQPSLHHTAVVVNASCDVPSAAPELHRTYIPSLQDAACSCADPQHTQTHSVHGTSQTFPSSLI